MTPGKGSKYREFYDLSGRITCMVFIQFGSELCKFTCIHHNALSFLISKKIVYVIFVLREGKCF